MFSDLFRPGTPLGAYSFALCGGAPAWLTECRTAADYEAAAEACRKAGIPYRVLGGLSNVLVSDKGYDGAVLLSRPGEIRIMGSSIMASAGVRMAVLARQALDAGLSGLEWAEGLPGTVGGAIYGNAGAFGSGISDIVSQVGFLSADGKSEILSPEGLHFGYRTGALKEGTLKGILTGAVFSLREDSPEAIRSRMADYAERRRRTQPHGVGSLGSVFRNPAGDSAGRLIESCGLKGASCGKASVSQVHANFIVTEKGVLAADYKSLMERVRDRVAEQTGITLVPEIELMGFEA